MSWNYTKQGNYTYHYAKEYWDMFDCEELECGKEWDGHISEMNLSIFPTSWTST